MEFEDRIDVVCIKDSIFLSENAVNSGWFDDNQRYLIFLTKLNNNEDMKHCEGEVSSNCQCQYNLWFLFLLPPRYLDMKVSP